MGKEEITRFQKRRLAALAVKMNEELRKTVPGVKEDVFEGGFRGTDGHTYAIMPNRLADKVSATVINEMMMDFNPEIESALSYRNPFENLAATVTSIIIWETPNAFWVNEKEPKTLKNNTKSPFYADNAMMNTWPPFMNMLS